MFPDKFQIRVCQNPNCGLRYPLVDFSTFGERCPACLGQTKPVLEQPLSQDQSPDNELYSTSHSCSVLLDNIRSALNVGSIFRSADGFGFQHIYLCGITPTPESPEVCKSALGAEQFVEWSAHKNALKLIDLLKGRGSEIWALEKTNHSIPLNSAVSAYEKSRPLALIVGNEVTGVDPGLQNIADQLVYLPMRGQKQSFNVAVAFAIAAQIIRSEF